MGDKGKFRGVDVAMESGDLDELTVDTGPGPARRELDLHGNPVHTPHRNLGSREVLSRLLDDDQLEVEETPSAGPGRAVARNPAGLKKGYDPYESGLLEKKERRKKKDLRALSEWIKAKKRAQPGEK
ncbi:MAG: hypothetical protein MUC71_08915 [Steroidobacteraceae bacterium]|jgi:hypothetical protein|nr:hypothetical protein [Steroidobacteraceae bacterium]